MAAGNPDLAQMAALYRQLGTSQPNPGDAIAQGVPSAMPSYGGSLNDLAAQQIMSSSRQAQQQQAGLYGQAGDLESQRRALEAQQAQQRQASVPHFGMVQPGEQHPSWTEMRPMTGQGLGHDILNILGNIGRAGVAGLAASGPGQAIEGVLYGPQRQALAATAEQLRSGEEAQKTGAQMYGAVSGEQARPFGAMAETGKTQQAGSQFQQAYAQKERQLAQQFDIAMSKISAEKDITKQNNETKEAIAHIMAQVREDGIKAGLTENEISNNTHVIVGRILANSSYMRTSPYLTGLVEGIGWQPNPAEANYQPSVQPSAQPARPQGSRGDAGGRGERTATGPGGHKIAFRGGRWVDAQSGKPVQ